MGWVGSGHTKWTHGQLWFGPTRPVLQWFTRPTAVSLARGVSQTRDGNTDAELISNRPVLCGGRVFPRRYARVLLCACGHGRATFSW